MIRPALCAAVAAAFAVPASAQGQPCHDLGAVTGVANDAMAQIPGLVGLCIRVDQHGQNRYEQAFGSYTLQEVVPLYSATKPISAAVMMSLVDQRLLDLDDPVAAYLPEYAVPPLDQITLRMCFSHTSGMQNDSVWILDTSITLRQAAQNIAQLPLQFTPGTAFSYGNVAMHVAGAVCEVASGQSWAQLFAQRIANPLGFTVTDYTAFGTTRNPRISGALRSNLREYSRFLEMLRGDGTWNGARVLSASAVETMLRDHTSGLRIVFSPNPHGAPYGLGMWLDQVDSSGRTTHASSPGFAGFTGWLDRARDATGVFLIRNAGMVTFPYWERVVAATDRALLPIGTACLGASSPPCAPATWLGAATWPRADLAGFALRADFAPAGGAGVVLLGPPLPAAVRLADLTAWVQPTWSAPVAADALGHADVALPLAGVGAGAAFAAQTVWLDASGCGQLGLRASHAAAVTVLP